MSDYVCTRCAEWQDYSTYSGLCTTCHDMAILDSRNALMDRVTALETENAALKARAEAAESVAEEASRRLALVLATAQDASSTETQEELFLRLLRITCDAQGLAPTERTSGEAGGRG